MSRTWKPFDDSQSEFENLEAIIRAAGNYVVPSDDLRPRTLEDARDLSLQRRELRRLGLASVLGGTLWGLSFAFVNSANAYRDTWVAPSGDELQRLVSVISLATHAEREWGLVEVFERLRSLQVHDLNRSPIHELESR